MKKFTNIDQIKAHQFAGNAYSDGDAFDAIHKFVIDQTNSLADRAEALRQVSDRGMGCGRDEDVDDEALVVSYMIATV